jgi:chemotaxis protein methyltransferase CheR
MLLLSENGGQIEESGVNELIAFLEKQSGWHLGESSREKILGLMPQRMRIVGTRSTYNYLEHIRSPSGADELYMLILSFLVGETYFFRNKNHWQALCEFVLPKLISVERAATAPFKFWSAACSTGEEAYSLAFTLSEKLACRWPGGIEILASDISQESLKKAKRGRYTDYSFRGVAPEVIEKFFTTGKYFRDVREGFSGAVSFDSLNLATEVYPEKYRGVDVIFCRNVLMYFQPEMAQRIIKRMFACLNRDGFLFIGDAESRIVPRELFESINCCDTFIYRKRSATGEPGKEAEITSLKQACRLPPDSQRQIKRKKIRKQTKRVQSPGEIADRTAVHKPRKVAVEEREHDPADRYKAALESYFREDYATALGSLTRGAEGVTGNFQELLLAGLSHLNMENFIEAEHCRQQALELSDIAPEGHLLGGMIKEAEGNLEGASRENMKAVFLDKSFFVPHFKLGQIYRRLGDSPKAAKHFSNALMVLDDDDEDRLKLFCGAAATKELLAKVCGE